MPRVPMLDRQVQRAPMPGLQSRVRVSSDAAGAATARGLQALGRGVGAAGEILEKIALREKAKADEAVVHEARRKLNDWEQQRIYDPKEGAYYKRGRDAFDLPQTLGNDYAKFTSELEQGLANDTQRAAFRRLAQARGEQIMDWTNRHVGAQRESFYDDQYKADVESSKERATAHVADENFTLADRRAFVDQELAIQRRRTIDRLHDRGASEEVIAQTLRGHESDTHARAIERLLVNNRDREAAAYYADVRERLDPDVGTKLEKALAAGSLRGESQRQADTIIRGHADRAGALEAVRKIKDPEIRDAAEKRVNDYYTTKKAAEAERRATLFLQAAKHLERVGGDLTKVPVTWLTELEPGQRHALETRSRQIRQGVEPTTDWDRYYGLLSIASEPATQQQFVRVDLMQYRHELSDTEFKDLVAKQAALRAGKQADEALDGYRTRKQVVDDALASVGLDPTPRDGSNDAKRVNEFRRQVDARIIDVQARTGKKATTAEVQEIVDALLIKGTIPDSGILFDTRKRLYELEPGEAFDVDVNEIPRAERQKIEEALRRFNRPVTPAAIVELFKARHMREREAR